MYQNDRAMTYLRRSAALRRTRSARASPVDEGDSSGFDDDDGDDDGVENDVACSSSVDVSASAEAVAAVFCCCLPVSRSSEACFYRVVIGEKWIGIRKGGFERGR